MPEMPLSDHEQRILDEIEQQLYAQDPNFARGVADTLTSRSIRDVRRGIALFASGFVVLVGFFFRPAVLIGVAAFLLMLAGGLLTYHNAQATGTDQIKAWREQIAFSRWIARLHQKIRGLGKRDDS